MLTRNAVSLWASIIKSFLEKKKKERIIIQSSNHLDREFMIEQKEIENEGMNILL